MTQLTILGVTHVSDLYPNVKYRIQLISELQPAVTSRTLVYDLGAGGLYKNLGKRGVSRKLGGYLRLCWGTLSVFARFVLNSTPQVYVVYPALPLIFLLSLLPRRVRPRIYMDAFISIYDTAVNDRAMLAADSALGRLLFWLERRAFLTAATVIVDTLENARYYTELFGIADDRFEVVPLSIPPLAVGAAAGQQDSGKFTCLFVGSLVPLHGIGAILAAAEQLADIPDLQFVIIGDGQEAWRIEQFQAKQAAVNLVWHRGMYPTDFLVHAIAGADLCLGIFGDTRKAARVLPYKLYYYAALAKPFLTLKTPCLQHYCRDAGAALLCEADGERAGALAIKIAGCVADRSLLAQLATESARLFTYQLSPAVIRPRLLECFGAVHR